MKRKTVRTALALFFISLLIAVPRAQQATAPVSVNESQDDRVALHQALIDLTNPWTVMCIAAHPDDEDGASLIVMRRKYGAHTVSLFSTFGEGGQNAIGPELYEELGAIRARETMAAAEIQGSEPYFLGLKDFGYSKSADEAFRFWDHDESLRRMVLQIRKLRPDVIITNHDTSRGHGHHQATGQLVLEAFDAAADPKRFPETLKDGVQPWQVQRLFVRGFGGATPSTSVPQPAGQKPDREGGLITIDPNESDQIRGMTYAEQALQALQKHATQGPWPKSVADMARFRNSPDGRLPLIRYRLVREAKGAAVLPADSRNFFAALKLPESFANELEMPMIDGRPLVDFAADRRKVLAQLIKYGPGRYRFTSDWSNYKRLALMRDRIKRATAVAAGVSFQVETPNRIVTRNSTVEFKVRISNAGTQPLLVFGCHSEIPSLREPVDPSKVVGGPTSGLQTWDELNAGSSLQRSSEVAIPATAPINIPISSHLYEPSGLGLQVRTHCSVGLGLTPWDSFGLEETTNLDVAPAVEIAEISPPLVVLTLPTAPSAGVRRSPAMLDFVLTLVNHANHDFKGEVISGSIIARIVSQPLVELRPRTSANVKIRLQADWSGTHSPAGHLIVPTSVSFSLKKLGSNQIVTTRAVPLVLVNPTVATNLSVGYIRGFDQSLPNALDALGVESKELSVDDVRSADLQKYSAILVDNRVYESQPEMIAANQKLLDYAKEGGTLIVFYHKSNEWNPDQRRNRPQLAPYKLILGDERITDENAPISFIEPQHPLLSVPNKIGLDDFAGWIQERGLYYPKEWDAQYHALLATNDPGEAPLRGGLLAADYGRGHYIYTSMVWYRQLRAGVPGAYRVLANMISYGRGAR